MASAGETTRLGLTSASSVSGSFAFLMYSIFPLALFSPISYIWSIEDSGYARGA